MHARQAFYFEQFNFVIHHKSGVDNKVPDALSRRILLLISLQSEIIGFKCLKEPYKEDEDFAEIQEKYSSRQPVQDFHMMDEFLLKGSRLCVSRTLLREKIIVRKLLETCMEAGLHDILGETRRWQVLKKDITG